MEGLYYFLKLKDGNVEHLIIGEKGIIDRQQVVDRIRELADDQYNVTEDIKEQAVKDLRAKIKDKWNQYHIKHFRSFLKIPPLINTGLIFGHPSITL